MKSLFLSLVVVFSSASAFAIPHEPEFCKMGWNSENTAVAKYFDTVSLNVATLKSITPFQLALVNDYLIANEITTQALSLDQIKALFAHGGEEQFNELWIHVRTSKVSGEQHIEVMSFPGDNPVGTIYSVKGRILGHNGDDSYSYITQSGEQSCSLEPR